MNRFHFKLALVAFMLLDHIGFLVPSEISIWLHVLTRFVGVGFAYLAVEGFLYTKSRTKYICRLYIAVILMMTGNFVLNLLFANPAVMISNNIFLTLAIGTTGLVLHEKLNHNFAKIASLIIILCISFLTEGGPVVIPFMLITYFNYHNPFKRNLYYLVFSLLLLVSLLIDLSTTEMSIYYILLFNPDFCFISIIPIISIYNGQEGLKNKFSQYFFYIFYPAHLWLLALVHYLMIK